MTRYLPDNYLQEWSLMTSAKKSLVESHPELALQAEGWDASTVTAGSNKKMSWRCSFGHVWDAFVVNRVRGTGCPICSGRTAAAGVNDLATTNPELAAQADGWDPTTVSAFSHKKVAWKCSLGHGWFARVAERSGGSGCPVCSNKSVLPGFNDLATTNPELAAQADGWDPTTVVAFSNKKVQWKCEQGHIWSAWIGNRTKGSGCPICSGRTAAAGVNDLATTSPELAAQADGWDPTAVVAGSARKLPWKCSLGHCWFARVSERSSGNGCPVCANKTILVGFNDLATTNPELAAQADGWDPTTVVAFSSTKYRWICPNRHKWIATVASRSTGSGCPVCSGLKALAGFNDLATTNPELAAQADGWDPTTVVAFSNKKVQWKCEKGHSWTAVVAARSRGNGCPFCSGLKALAGFNDLATTNPELAAQADGWDPTTVVGQSHKSLSWKCELGHQWKSTVKNRTRSGGCPICSNKKLLPGFNDLATTNPELAAQADGWDPTTIFANTSLKLSWRCPEGHVWEAAANNRSQGKGCPVCAVHGFNPGKDGWLYFLSHDGLDLFQIGITNVPKTRITKHLGRGWAIIDVRGPMDGYLTRNLESAILRAVERRGGIRAHKSGHIKFDGYSESWTKSSLSAHSLKELLLWVYEDDL